MLLRYTGFWSCGQRKMAAGAVRGSRCRGGMRPTLATIGTRGAPVDDTLCPLLGNPRNSRRNQNAENKALSGCPSAEEIDENRRDMFRGFVGDDP